MTIDFLNAITYCVSKWYIVKTSHSKTFIVESLSYYIQLTLLQSEQLNLYSNETSKVSVNSIFILPGLNGYIADVVSVSNSRPISLIYCYGGHLHTFAFNFYTFFPIGFSMLALLYTAKFFSLTLLYQLMFVAFLPKTPLCVS